MQLILQRDFVCAADDQTNDSMLALDVPDCITLQEFLTQVLGIGYLQYSSSHRCLVVKSGEAMALVVPEEKEAIYISDRNSLLTDNLAGSEVDFSFSLSREEERLYGEYRRKKLFG